MNPVAYALIHVVLLSTGNTFLYCFVGSLTTDQFRRYGDIAYEFKWYNLPIDMQKYFPLIIGNAQRPKVFTGLNIIDLNLSAFTKVKIAFRKNCIVTKVRMFLYF